MALSDYTTAQLAQLSPQDGVPAQAINAEMLRRAQLTNASGNYGSKVPAMAQAYSNPAILQNIPNYLQGVPAATQPTPMPGQIPATANPQAQLPYTSIAERNRADQDAEDNAPGVFSGIAGMLRNGLQSTLGAAAPAPTTPYTADPNAIPQGFPQAATDALNNQQALQLSTFDKLLGGVSGKGPELNVKPLQADYDKYAQQLAKELPDNMSDVKAQIAEQLANAKRQGGNALGQGLMTAGLSMLGSHQPFFQALGDAGQQGIARYNQQNENADQQQRSLLNAQAQAAAADQARQAAISQGATQRGAEDVRSAYENNRNNIMAWQAQYGAQMQKAMLGAQRLAMMGDPVMKLAMDRYQSQVGMAKGLMASPLTYQQGIQLEQNANQQLTDALQSRSLKPGIPSLLPTAPTPAASVR